MDFHGLDFGCRAMKGDSARKPRMWRVEGDARAAYNKTSAPPMLWPIRNRGTEGSVGRVARNWVMSSRTWSVFPVRPRWRFSRTDLPPATLVEGMDCYAGLGEEAEERVVVADVFGEAMDES